MPEILTVGIAGGSGSGKTTLTKRLKERFGDLVTVSSTTIIICRTTTSMPKLAQNSTMIIPTHSKRRCSHRIFLSSDRANRS